MRGWEAFGQKVSLTARIREVLDAYPDDTTIIKEMVQNADDAGAQVVRFVYDRRSHGTQRLQFENFAHYQGPALLVYNDSIFKREDFESIQAVGDSGKKAREEALTGRFGVGFNVVYHVTDVPSFVSDSKIVFFDPHCRIDPSITVANPGCLLDFVENPQMPLSMQINIHHFLSLVIPLRNAMMELFSAYPFEQRSKEDSPRFPKRSLMTRLFVDCLSDLRVKRMECSSFSRQLP